MQKLASLTLRTKTLQKWNSGRQMRLSSSAFKVLALVANERHAKVFNKLATPIFSAGYFIM